MSCVFNLTKTKCNFFDECFDECEKQRKEVAFFMRRIYKQGLTTCSGGNLSMRYKKDKENYVLITPSGLDKGEIQENSIAILTIDGENLTPELKPSIETEMHLMIFKTRPDINAIVHAHPVTATSFSALKQEINCQLTAEAYFVLGTPKYAPYALMGTQKLAKIVSECAIDSNVIIMQNHGVITVGSTMLKAFDRLEVLEAAAKMTLITSSMQNINPMTQEMLDEIKNNY